jgi:hypothetical protein
LNEEDDMDDTIDSWQDKRKALKERGGQFAPRETEVSVPPTSTSWAGGQIETPNDERRRKKQEALEKLSQSHSVSKVELQAKEMVGVEPEVESSSPPGANATASENPIEVGKEKKKSRMEMLRERHLQMQKQ